MYCEYDQKTVIEMLKAYEGWQQVEAGADFIVDYFGYRVPIRYAKYVSEKAGMRIERPPFPDDGIRAGFIEYLPIIESIRDCDSVYQMAEIGACYAPFSAICAKLALRQGASKVVLRPVEAAQKGVESIYGNFLDNDLLDSRVDLRVIQAAVVGEYKNVYFPNVDCTIDNGAAPQDQASERDVRGTALPMVKVRGIPISHVIDSFPHGSLIDLLHIDIQGSEKYALPMDIQIITSRVKRVMLGTHSRPIEGKLIEVFHNAGWRLIAEAPCEFKYRRDLDSIEGMTIADGAQYWINEALVGSRG